MWFIQVFEADTAPALTTSVADTLAPTETLTVAGPLTRSTADTVSLAESLTSVLVGAPNIALGDALSLSELLTVTGGALPALPIETWTVPDAVNTLNGDHPWNTYIGGNQWQVVSGRARLAGAGTAHNEGGRLSYALGRANYTVTATVQQWQLAGGTAYFGVLGRLQGDTSLTFYEVLLYSTGGAHYIGLYKFVAGVQTLLGSLISIVQPIPGTTVGLRMNGDQITAFLNGVPTIVQTDTGIPTGQFAGLLGGADTGHQVEVDNLTLTEATTLLQVTVTETVTFSEAVGLSGPIGPTGVVVLDTLSLAENLAVAPTGPAGAISVRRRVNQMGYAGDFRVGTTVYLIWDTAGLNGASITRATNGTLKIYRDDSAIERLSLSGITEIEDFDNTTGVHTVKINLADNTDPGFYAAGHDYQVVMTGMVVDGTLINAAIGQFSIENRLRVADIFAELIEGSTTFRESMRLANAANGGKSSGMESGTPILRDLADGKDRVRATVDLHGNRTSVTRDLS